MNELQPPGPGLGQILADQLRLLAFRPTSAAVGLHWRRYLAWGLIVTWFAGVGRYWDNPRAQLWQHLGVGSLVYVFCLATLLWLVLWPLKPRHWSLRNVLVFVTLTSLPAWLYAIPVERFMTLESARSANVWFLATVATWRVALLFVFLRRVAALRWGEVIVAGLMPLTAIVTALSMLNLERAVFDIMGGLGQNGTSADQAYLVLMMITGFSWLAFPVLLVAWIVLIAKAPSISRK